MSKKVKSYISNLFEKIKEDMRKSDGAQESYTYTTGITFKETHRESRFSQKKYYAKVRDSINNRIDSIKNQAVADLKRFVTETTTAYSRELTNNAKNKRDELNAIAQAKQTAEDIQNTITKLVRLLTQLQPMRERVKGLNRGVENHV